MSASGACDMSMGMNLAMMPAVTAEKTQAKTSCRTRIRLMLFLRARGSRNDVVVNDCLGKGYGKNMKKQNE